MPGGIQHNNLGWVAPRESPSLNILSSGGDNNAHAIGRHGSVGSETGHIVSQNLPDQSRSLVIPITLGGIRGAIVARFIDFRRPFHAGRDTRA